MKPIMTDAEVADLLGVSRSTLVRRLRNPVKGEVDLNKANPEVFGSRRFWLRANVMKVLGVKENS